MKSKATTTVSVINSTNRWPITQRFRLFSSWQFCISRMLVGVIFAATASWVRADDTERIASLVDQMRTGQTERAALKAQEEELTDQSEANLKEMKAYKSSLGQLEAEKKGKIENSPVMKDAKRRLQATDDMVEEWNSHYAKDRVGLLPEETYNEGVRRKAQVERTVNAIRADVTRSIENFQRTQIAPIEAIQARQQKAINELAERVKRRFTTWQQLKEKSDLLETKLQSIRAALIDGCKSATTIESLKYCSSIGWDNMRKDLPPLTDIRAPFNIRANP